MYVTRLGMEGLRDAPPEMDGLERVVRLPAPPARCAVADGLILLAGVLRPDQRPGFSTLGWGPDVEAIGEPEDGGLQLQGLDPSAVRSAVEGDARAITVEADIHLDPPLYGRLRAQAVRDPRVVTALGQRPVLSVKVGWLFNGDYTVVTPSILALRVGDVAFQTVGKDRPLWVPEILRDIGARFGRTEPFEPFARVELRLRDALLAADPARRAGYRAWVEHLMAPPFGLPEPGVAEVMGRATVVVGPELRRVRQWGRSAADAARIVAAAVVDRPDVLIVEEAVEPKVAEWLASLPDFVQAPIEQVWMDG